MNVNSVSSSDIGKTDRGTRIVKPGQDMDKNAFLKILTAELSNQDPQNTQDSTQYVSQLAQFSSLEQMSNLNNTMTLAAASSLVGKTVNLDEIDEKGNYYSGVVQAVNNDSGNVTISVAVNQNGVDTVKEYNYSDVNKILNTQDSSVSNMDSNLSFLLATSLLGAHVQLDSKDSSGKDYSGVVKGVNRENGTIKLSVLIDGTNNTKDFTYDQVLNVHD